MSNTKHYRKVSEKPVIPDAGIYRLYSMRFGPYAARTHLVLDAKNIPYHTINVNLADKPEWLFEANLLGKVPALELVDKPNKPFIYESMLLSEYLDEVHPQNKLYPSDPLKKCKKSSGLKNFPQLFFTERGAAQWDDIQKGLDEFEQELSKRGTTYFGGDTPKILDYSIYQWFFRTE